MLHVWVSKCNDAKIILSGGRKCHLCGFVFAAAFWPFPHSSNQIATLPCTLPSLITPTVSIRSDPERILLWNFVWDRIPLFHITIILFVFANFFRSSNFSRYFISQSLLRRVHRALDCSYFFFFQKIREKCFSCSVSLDLISRGIWI